MANGFDVVPVRASDESRVVIRVVVRAQTRRAVVCATGLQGRALEVLDLLPVLGCECQVKRRGLLWGLVHRRSGVGWWAGASDRVYSRGTTNSAGSGSPRTTCSKRSVESIPPPW